MYRNIITLGNLQPYEKASGPEVQDNITFMIGPTIYNLLIVHLFASIFPNHVSIQVYFLGLGTKCCNSSLCCLKKYSVGNTKLQA